MEPEEVPEQRKYKDGTLTFTSTTIANPLLTQYT